MNYHRGGGDIMLPGENKTRKQLISELAALRRRVAELAASEAEYKQVEDALRESKEVFEKTFTSQRDAIFILDAKSPPTIMDCNPAAIEMFGYARQEMLGHTTAFLHLDEAALRKFQEYLYPAIEKRGFFHLPEFAMKRRDGAVFATEHTVVPLKDQQGKRIGWVSVIRDITESKQAEEGLQAEKNKLHSVIDAIEYGLSIQDTDYNIIYQNEPLRIIFGDHVGEKCYRVYEGEEKICDGCPVEKAFRDGKPHTSERRVIIPSGEVTFWENTANPIRDARGEIVSCLEIARNITERKQAEKALQESEEKYRGLVSNVKLGVFRSTPGPAGIFLEVNPAMEEITGYSRKELLRMNVSDLYVQPEEREVVLEEIASATGKKTRELRFKKKDGTEIVVSDTKVAVRDDGNIIYFDGILEDITERKRAEEEEKRLQQELLISGRLASIGELAAGVAHEINNPLTGVLGFSQRLLRKSTDEEFTRDLGIIYSEAQRVARVVQNLLTFARRREPTKQYSNINDILQKTLELRGYELQTSNIEVVTDFATNLPGIMVDFYQIQEVFLNIILNAEQAMNEAHGGGKLIIKTREIKDYVRISFADDGCGIPPEQLVKVFDPFFTTRAEKGGTGLGLSACHGIVTEHGGRIYVKSKPEKGATFFVELPLSPIETTFVRGCL